MKKAPPFPAGPESWEASTAGNSQPASPAPRVTIRRAVWDAGEAAKGQYEPDTRGYRI
jgi:hypothetical protein